MVSRACGCAHDSANKTKSQFAVLLFPPTALECLSDSETAHSQDCVESARAGAQQACASPAISAAAPSSASTAVSSKSIILGHVLLRGARPAGAATWRRRRRRLTPGRGVHARNLGSLRASPRASWRCRRARAGGRRSHAALCTTSTQHQHHSRRAAAVLHCVDAPRRTDAWWHPMIARARICKHDRQGPGVLRLPPTLEYCALTRCVCLGWWELSPKQKNSCVRCCCCFLNGHRALSSAQLTPRAAPAAGRLSRPAPAPALAPAPAATVAASTTTTPPPSISTSVPPVATPTALQASEVAPIAVWRTAPVTPSRHS